MHVSRTNLYQYYTPHVSAEDLARFKTLLD
jgi:hypothetical protein